MAAHSTCHPGHPAPQRLSHRNSLPGSAGIQRVKSSGRFLCRWIAASVRSAGSPSPRRAPEKIPYPGAFVTSK